MMRASEVLGCGATGLPISGKEALAIHLQVAA
jgi:hypothetical protein